MRAEKAKLPRGTKAVNFLNQLYPGGLWVLTSIIPDGPTRTETFEDDEEARRWIARENAAGRNVYYTLNRTRTPLRSKAKKTDITHTEALHVDIDPASDESPDEFKERIIPKLETFDRPPSVVVDTGNGVQAVWFLDKPIKVDGPETIADIEARNHALAEAFGGDASARNIDRILRLPGTTNYPNAKKRKLGRQECQARLLWFKDIAYPLSKFPPCEKGEADCATTRKSGGGASEIPPHLEALLHLTEPAPYKSRSELSFAFLCGALQKGIDPKGIVSACLDPKHKGHAIYEECIEKGGEKHVLRQLEHAREKTKERVGRQKPSPADVLIALAAADELFHTPDGEGYADIIVDDHRETWPVESKAYKGYLSKRYYEATKGAPSRDVLNTAIGVIGAKAHFDGPEHRVYARVAAVDDDRIYLDLGDETWQAVEITPDGWRVIKEPPVRFRRANGMKALPEPRKGGSIEQLRDFVNVKRKGDFVLVVSHVLAALRGKGPYPILVVNGEQGSAKSTLCRLLRELVDPNEANLRSLPRGEHDLSIAAKNAHVLAYDNVSTVSDWLSDALCRMSTGGGNATRKLYTDDDEVIFVATRPIIMNGITSIVSRPDLAQRALFITLARISDENRRTERAVFEKFGRDRPQILGVLLDAVAEGLRRLPKTERTTKPRMADFYIWATACEPALFEAGEFDRAYDTNRSEATAEVIEDDLVATAVRTRVEKEDTWSGTPGELLSVLTEEVGVATAKAKSWPTTPRALRAQLERATTMLRDIGIVVSFGTKRSSKRGSKIITIEREANNSTKQCSERSEPSEGDDEAVERADRNERRGRSGSSERTERSERRLQPFADYRKARFPSKPNEERARKAKDGG